MKFLLIRVLTRNTILAICTLCAVVQMVILPNDLNSLAISGGLATIYFALLKGMRLIILSQMPKVGQIYVFYKGGLAYIIRQEISNKEMGYNTLLNLLILHTESKIKLHPGYKKYTHATRGTADEKNAKYINQVCIVHTWAMDLIEMPSNYNYQLKSQMKELIKNGTITPIGVIQRQSELHKFLNE